MTEGTIIALDAQRAPPESRTGMTSGRHGQSSPLAGVRGLIFDATDMLHDATSWRRRLLRLVHQLGVPGGYDDFFRSWDRDYVADVYRGRREFCEALESFLLNKGLSWAQIDEIEAATRMGREASQACVRPLPCLDKTLAELADLGLALAAWADAPQPGAQLVSQLEQLPLVRKFRRVLSSCDIEAMQPSRECYQAGLRALGLPADDVLYVGHNPLHLAGAKAAGLGTVTFNFQPHAQADVCLARFEDLPAYVCSCRASGRRAA